ncbi:MAG: hypothetical protein D6B25_18450 [Desulfobulbaceae bacterium]|nr:MAG: hypothetical protein D6B25_18450 [Desulfobulbaceae bacterium]
MTAVKDIEQKLTREIEQYDRLAIAFSGGVDSTLLLYVACKTLGYQNVVAVFADSVFQSAKSRAGVNTTILEQFNEQLKLIRISIDPFKSDEIINNDKNRCYFCKKLIYQTILAKLKELNFTVLADGTNCSDLELNRPGIKAIEELQIKTPYVNGGLSKRDIRVLARHYNLPQATLPSNSCLAARTETGRPLELKMLEEIEDSELYLASLGFVIFRVKPRGTKIFIELGENDFTRLNNPRIREKIISYFQSHNKDSIFLDLSPRS